MKQIQAKLTLLCVLIILIKLRMEKGNVSKRQQPDHRTDNSRRSPTGLHMFPYVSCTLLETHGTYAVKIKSSFELNSTAGRTIQMTLLVKEM